MRHVPILLMAVCSLMMCVCGCHVRLYEGCAWQAHLLWPVSHVNVWHMIGNLIAAHTIMRSEFKDELWMWLYGYALCVLMPDCIGMQGTEGMSGVLYFVMGAISWQALSKPRFHVITVGCMAVGLVFPSLINNWVHVICYVAGISGGYISRRLED